MTEALSGVFLKINRAHIFYPVRSGTARAAATRGLSYLSLREVKATHRERGSYTPRKHSEVYAGDFGSEIDALMLDNTIAWEKNFESSET